MNNNTFEDDMSSGICVKKTERKQLASNKTNNNHDNTKHKHNLLTIKEHNTIAQQNI